MWDFQATLRAHLKFMPLCYNVIHLSLHFSPVTFSCLGVGGIFFFTRAGIALLSTYNARRERHVSGRCKTESNYNDRLCKPVGAEGNNMQ